MERKRRVTKYVNDGDEGPSNKIDKVIEEQLVQSTHREEDGETEYEPFDLEKLNNSSRNSINQKIKKEILPEGTIFRITGYEKHVKKTSNNNRYSPYKKYSGNDDESFTKVTIEVVGNCYEEYNTPESKVKSKPHEVEKGVIKSMILSDKKLDIWASKKLHNMIDNAPPPDGGDAWFDGLLAIVKPRNERLQVFMQNEWTALYYIYENKLKELLKQEKLSMDEWVHNYCESVKKSNEVTYVD